jgi:hypothetical protein
MPGGGSGEDVGRSHCISFSLSPFSPPRSTLLFPAAFPHSHFLARPLLFHLPILYLRELYDQM